MSEHMCEECDLPMYPFAVIGGPAGYSCDGCGWSFDTDDGPEPALAPAAGLVAPPES